MLVIVGSDQLSIDQMIESRITFTLMLRQKNTNNDLKVCVTHLPTDRIKSRDDRATKNL